MKQAMSWFGALFTTLAMSGAATAQELDMVFYGAALEQFEYRQGDENETLATWDGDAFIGTDDLKIRWISEGGYDTDNSLFETLENQIVGQIPVSGFFDAKAGIRLDTPDGADRWYGVAGITGLAPQWIEVDANVFVSEKGDASVRLEAEYELLLTNHWILTPSAEIDLAFSEDREIHVGSGISTSEIGVRLSYDAIDRLFSPYIGIVQEQAYGNTEDLKRGDGEDTGVWFLTVGARMVF